LDAWVISYPETSGALVNGNLGIAFPEMNEQERRRLLSGCFWRVWAGLLGEFSQLPKATPQKLRQLIRV